MMIVRLIHTGVVLFLLCCIGIVLGIPLFIILCIPLRWRYANGVVGMITHFFYWLVLRALLIPIIYGNKRQFDHESVIFVANHQSALDIPLVGLLSGTRPHLWLARKDLSNNSVARLFVSRFAIMVDLQSARESMRSLLKVIKLLTKTATSMVIFPEGERYADGKIHAFSHGFVILASKTGRPVVPVYIVNAYKVYSSAAYLLTWAPIYVYVGEPMRQHSTETDDAFAERVRGWFMVHEGKLAE